MEQHKHKTVQHSTERIKKLPRRTQLKIGRTIRGAEVPEVATPVAIEQLEGQRFESAGAGVFLFAPFITQLNFEWKPCWVINPTGSQNRYKLRD
jgi:hypothetical protein